MHPTFLKTAAKCITKLTDKAKAALDEKLEASSKTSSNKRKNADSSVTTHVQPKKIKSAPPKVHRSVILSEGEETSGEEAILISDSENNGNQGTIRDVDHEGENAEDEHDEESAEDELSKRPSLSCNTS